jgi:lipoate-protein ligase A
VLKVPNEKFRDKISQSLRERMTTVLLETGSIPDRDEVKEDLVRLYEETLDIELVRGSLNNWEKSRMNELRPKYQSDEWLHWRRGGRLTDARKVRISASTTVGTANFKAPGGLIRTTVEDVDATINEVVISGDFFMLPIDAITKLEVAMKGVGTAPEEVLAGVKKAYREIDIESPGITPEDVAKAISMAIEPQ